MANKWCNEIQRIRWRDKYANTETGKNNLWYHVDLAREEDVVAYTVLQKLTEWYSRFVRNVAAAYCPAHMLKATFYDQVYAARNMHRQNLQGRWHTDLCQRNIGSCVLYFAFYNVYHELTSHRSTSYPSQLFLLHEVLCGEKKPNEQPYLPRCAFQPICTFHSISVPVRSKVLIRTQLQRANKSGWDIQA